MTLLCFLSAAFLSLSCGENNASEPQARESVSDINQDAAASRATTWLKQIEEVFAALESPDQKAITRYVSALAHAGRLEALRQVIDQAEEPWRQSLLRNAAAQLISRGLFAKSDTLPKELDEQGQRQAMQSALRTVYLTNADYNRTLEIAERYSGDQVSDAGAYAAAFLRRWELAEQHVRQIEDAAKRTETERFVRVMKMVETPKADWPELDAFNTESGNCAYFFGKLGSYDLVMRAIKLVPPDKQYEAGMRAVESASRSGHAEVAGKLWEAIQASGPKPEDMNREERGRTAFAAARLGKPHARDWIESLDIASQPKIASLVQIGEADRTVELYKEDPSSSTALWLIRELVRYEQYDIVDRVIADQNPEDKLRMLSVAMKYLR